MKPWVVKDKFIPRGRINFPGDKSIAHRALILSALSKGKSIINNFPLHDDSLATLYALETLGVKIQRSGQQLLIWGRGGLGLKRPKKSIFVNNSGTTLRLLCGLLSGQNFKSKLTVGKYLKQRPMARVNIPLRLMGAKISAKKIGRQEYPPLNICGQKLHGISYFSPVASAQVKGAILLAGLSARGKTEVRELLLTRDHTERMLKVFGANLSVKKNKITLTPGRELISPGKIYIPGDISSAAFFMVLTTIIPGSRIIMQKVSLNPGRLGIIKLLKRMGADIKIEIIRAQSLKNFEPLGNLIVKSSKLKGVNVSKGEIPFVIDELPILMVAACFAKGRTTIHGANELRVKETDRINSMVSNLKSMQAQIQVHKISGQENIVIQGQGWLCGAKLKSCGDHRTAMSMIVAALAARGESELDDVNCINKSFPGFLDTLGGLRKQ